MDSDNPCCLDLMDARQIIQRFRDLISIGPMLDIDVPVELDKLKKQLKEVGWGLEYIDKFQMIAASSTFWEYEIPKNIREQGNQRTFQDIKARSK